MTKSSFDEVFGRMQRRATAAADEGLRIERVRALGFVPEDVGPEIPFAPARGRVRMVESVASYPKGADEFELKPAGWMGRKTLQRADSFDVMMAKAQAAHARAVSKARDDAKAKAAKFEPPAFVPPFSPAQIAMGRFYRDLVEKHACAGVKCSSVESLSSGSGGDGGGFMDAVLADAQRIDILRRRIGCSSAMVVRRVRPSGRGSRVTIFDRRLVDIVCLEDGTISDVLRAHGWSIKADLITTLQLGLAHVLERMMGPVRRGKIQFAEFGSADLGVDEK